MKIIGELDTGYKIKEVAKKEIKKVVVMMVENPFKVRYKKGDADSKNGKFDLEISFDMKIAADTNLTELLKEKV